MNDDTQFDGDFLAIGRATLARHPRALLLAYAYGEESGELLDAGVRADWSTLRFTAMRPYGVCTRSCSRASSSRGTSW